MGAVSFHLEFNFGESYKVISQGLIRFLLDEDNC